MMVVRLLTLAVLVFWAQSAQAQVDRDIFIEDCLSDNATSADFCNVYIGGFLGGMSTTADSFAETHAFVDQKPYPDFLTRRAGICMPPKTTYNDVTRIVQNHIRAQFSNLRDRPQLIVFDALQTRFGCPRVEE